MNCTYVCNACRQISLKRFSQPVVRKRTWRASSTSATTTTPEIPPRHRVAREEDIINPGNFETDKKTRYAHANRAQRSAQDDYLQKIFKASIKGGRLHPRARKAQEESLRSQENSRDVLDYSLTASQQTILDPLSSVAPLEAAAKGTKKAKAQDSSSYATVERGIGLKRAHQIRHIGIQIPVSLETIQSHIGKAIERQDVSRMDDLWAEAQELIGDVNPAENGDELISSLYAQFLWGFTSVLRPNRAVQIWNGMVEKNISPTMAMWDTMLNGFAAVRNSDGVQDIWNMMLDTGLKPDKRLWATRIRALAQSEAWSLSMQAFQEMMESWLRAVKENYPQGIRLELANIGDMDQTPKPSIEALNGLVHGLVRSKKQEELMRTLSWAQVLGIKMDSYTFNPIVRMALKDRNGVLVSKILEKMQDLGIKRDIATYTMILQSVFQVNRFTGKHDTGFVSNAPLPTDSMQEKLDAITVILEEVEESGLEANTYTFSTLISGLLKDGGSLEAADAVRLHMASKSIGLSSQIYTSFVTAHFTRDGGPDLPAVVAVWEQARGDESTVLDGIFYDRLIEGFAKSGETGRTKVALAQSGKAGHVPGWLALTQAIMALGKAGDWHSAQEIVEDVRMEERDLDRVRKGKGKKWFWDTARSMGLGNEEVVEET